jgi:hypothetical protein
MSDFPGYDAWATGGRYRSWPVVIECLSCGNEFSATGHHEYGTVWIEPEECPVCGEYEDENLIVRNDEGPDPG